METRASSIESDRRHLLKVSRPSSLASFTTDNSKHPTPTQSTVRLRHVDNQTTTNGTARSLSEPGLPSSYKGFPSRAAYLDALQSFAHEKRFFTAEQQLRGFYGTKTSEDYLREAEEAKHARKKEKTRSNSELPSLNVIQETEDEGTPKADSGRRASLANLGRRLRGRASIA